eukprot:355497-Chlamydomonas_euryale.AAC.3
MRVSACVWAPARAALGRGPKTRTLCGYTRARVDLHFVWTHVCTPPWAPPLQLSWAVVCACWCACPSSTQHGRIQKCGRAALLWCQRLGAASTPCQRLGAAST